MAKNGESTKKTKVTDDINNENKIIPQIDVIKVINKHKNDLSINPHMINPNYLKKTEAEENFERNNN